MSDGVPAEPIRIGHGERQAAVEALRHHHEAGRIDSQEYEERSVRAEGARSQGDLDALFTDLPQPHAGRPTPTAVVGETHSTLTPGAPAPEAVAKSQTPGRGVLNIGEPWGTTIVSVAPILAVVLFFVTDSWLWFLAIPVVAVLVYGPDGRYGVGPDSLKDKDKKDKKKG
ncbi:hypothetical protein Kisp01_63670 [Kineosporia sp. NBRC 101677]|uniref:DUF1707 SHOCT-like domain-containing protein n=1 Tax=Kineosporia sp. NBRC 101677 TaxID=3032197 RepID=UPI0024A10909|nr:DUF1707 domain-containing protein [Kineosporia sp. NBRC 101677]GLY19353.1 hypothetical protein Kisp01_63670 [Kineosporia sp. NBRC 101677]